jgi:hypothetical protein
MISFTETWMWDTKSVLFKDWLIHTPEMGTEDTKSFGRMSHDFEFKVINIYRSVIEWSREVSVFPLELLVKLCDFEKHCLLRVSEMIHYTLNKIKLLTKSFQLLIVRV